MDDDQQFCLRWNNHQSTLVSVFDTLWANGTLVDCTLAAEGKSIKAHKVVLSACSPYFAALLQQQYDKHPIFILKDVKFQELRAMMDYMYRGEVNISQDQLAALLKAAESLQIKGLSDNSRSNNNNNAMNKSNDNIVKPPPTVPAVKSSSGAAAGMTVENKRPLKSMLGVVAADLDTDASAISREGSTSPARKRKKAIVRRRSIESNNVLDNHEQLSNSSSHSTTHATNNITTSTTNVLPVTKKTDHESKQTGDNAGSDDAGIDSANEEKGAAGSGKDNTTHSELMIEPKNEYDDDDGNEPVEDLTLDDEDMMDDDLDQAGPSHGGEGSSSGYGNWQMERSQEEAFLTGQDGGQHRDAQGSGSNDGVGSGGSSSNMFNHVFEYKDIWHNLKFSDLSRLINADGRYSCPRDNCAKTYKDASSLQRHIRYECGGMKKFRCIMCGKAFSQGSHLKRHLESGVCIKYYF